MAALAAGNPDAFERTEFYYDWARPNRYVRSCMNNREHKFVGLTVTRPSGAPEFSAADIQVARRTAPHLLRAVAAYEKLEEIRRINEGLMDALDRMRRGVFGLGVDGRVIFANETARTVLAAGGAFRMDNGVLAAARPDQTRALRQMLRSVVRGNAPATLIVERSDGRPPLRLEPVRLGPAADLIDLRTPPLLLLLVDDPEMNTGGVAARAVWVDRDGGGRSVPRGPRQGLGVYGESGRYRSGHGTIAP